MIYNRDRQFKLLLAAKANPNLADRTGNTLLHVAGQINMPWHALDLLLADGDRLIENAQSLTFDVYLFMTPERLLNKRTREGLGAVEDYMTLKGLPIELERVNVGGSI